MARPAGYSGTPLVRKLGIREGDEVALLGAPPGFPDLLAGLPPGVRLVDVGTDGGPGPGAGQGPFPLVLLFAPDQAALEARFSRALGLMDPWGALWVSWPKKSSRLFVDLTEDGIRAVALPTGVVDNKVCAVDADWSGLRLVVRKANRPPRP